MTIRYEFVKRTVAGESFLVPVGEAAKKFNGLFALNELAAFIWDRLPEVADDAALVEAVLEAYDVTRETAEADTAEFLGVLRSIGIID